MTENKTELFVKLKDSWDSLKDRALTLGRIDDAFELGFIAAWNIRYYSQENVQLVEYLEDIHEKVSRQNGLSGQELVVSCNIQTICSKALAKHKTKAQS